MHNLIDTAIHFFQHEFWMLFAGLTFYFYFKYSLAKNRGDFLTFKDFWEDQNDEVGVSFTGGLIFLVWDDETLEAVTWLINFWKTEDVELVTMEKFYYLIVGPVIERGYTLIQALPDFTRRTKARIKKKI
jgi:hypothetical protein